VFDRVTKAVFPVAGLGTRFLPATKAQPKEMLCVVDKPLIQYAVEEAYEAGIRHMVFVTGRNKRSIEDHFDFALELETELERGQKHELLALVRSVLPADMVCSYVRQPKALGLGHAVLCAAPLVGNEPFAVLLADDLMVGTPAAGGITQQLVREFLRTQSSVLAVQDVAPSETRKYGIVDTSGSTEALAALRAIVEKPAPEDAPSRLGVAGRYVLGPEIFAQLAKQRAGAGGEIQLTDAISGLIALRAVYALRYQGQRFDCGSKIGFLQATLELAKHHPEVGAEFSALLRAAT
jgi:UTP--glucose-1-phosphate uridylyltransferase